MISLFFIFGEKMKGINDEDMKFLRHVLEFEADWLNDIINRLG